MILGGGLVGLTTAFSLSERGVAVTVIDEGPLGSGAARGNAGWIAPSQLGPLASPYALKEALRAVGRPHSAVYLRPAGALRISPWLLRFVRNCTADKAEAGRAALHVLDEGSTEALAALGRAGIDLEGVRGIVSVHDDEASAEHAAVAHGATKVVTGEALRALVPFIGDRTAHGVVLERDRSIDPGRFIDSLIEVLGERGVMFVPGSPVRTFETDGTRVRAVLTDHGRHAADVVVLAAGAGTAALAGRLGMRLPVIAGKGYSFSVAMSGPMPHSVLFETRHVVCTPLGDRVRVAGTMELGGIAGHIDHRRIDGIVRAATRLMPALDVRDRKDEWVGSRPITPDGVPIIGRPAAWSNVLVGAGHAMFGVTLAPATGEVLARLAVDDADLDREALAPFHPDRF